MGRFLKLLPKIVQVVKILARAYKAGHEAGLWTEGHRIDEDEQVLLLEKSLTPSRR